MKKLFIFSYFFISFFLQAKDPIHPFSSTVKLSTGNSGITNSNGINSFLYNPALLYLSSSKPKEYKILNPQITVSESFFDLYDDYYKGNFKKDTNYLKIIDDWNKKNLYAQVQNMLGANLNLISFSFLSEAHANIYFDIDYDDFEDNKNNRLEDQIDIDIEENYGMYVGSSYSFLENYFIGFALKSFITKAYLPIYNTELIKKNIVEKKKTKIAEYYEEGHGYYIDGDLGFLYKKEGKVSKSLGLVIQNIFESSYKSINNKKKPPKQKRLVSLGASLVSKYKFKNTFSLSLDFVDILNQSKFNYLKKIHLGFHWQYLEYLNIAFGINQGYPSFGIQLKYKVLSFDFSHFTQELGKYPGDIPSLRYSAGLSIGWNL